MQLLSFEEFLAKFQEELDIGYWESGCQYEADHSYEDWYELNYKWYTSTGRMSARLMNIPG